MNGLESNMTNLIALDLELEQPKANPQTPDSKIDEAKIIQLGWVVFKPLPGGSLDVLKERREYVNIGVPLSAFIKNLTGITDEQVAGGTYLVEAYNELRADRLEFEASRVVRQWGNDDMEHMREEIEGNSNPLNSSNIALMRAHNYQWEFGRGGFNVKHLYQAFALANGMNTSGGLSKCINRCGLNWMGQGGKHDALNDALNTAQIYAFLQSRLQNVRQV